MRSADAHCCAGLMLCISGSPYSANVPVNGRARLILLTSSTLRMPSRSPGLSVTPGTLTNDTTPSSCATSGRYIFMTSISAIVCPATTCSPFSTSRRTSFPGDGEQICVGSRSSSMRHVCPSITSRVCPTSSNQYTVWDAPASPMSRPPSLRSRSDTCTCCCCCCCCRCSVQLVGALCFATNWYLTLS